MKGCLQLTPFSPPLFIHNSAKSKAHEASELGALQPPPHPQKLHSQANHFKSLPSQARIFTAVSAR